VKSKLQLETSRYVRRLNPECDCSPHKALVEKKGVFPKERTLSVVHNDRICPGSILSRLSNKLHDKSRCVRLVHFGSPFLRCDIDACAKSLSDNSRCCKLGHIGRAGTTYCAI
jgi:hypothetical protein